MPPTPNNPIQGSPVATALQPLNVQMAQLADELHKLNAAATGAAGATGRAAEGGLAFDRTMRAVTVGIQRSASVSGIAVNQMGQFADTVMSVAGRFVQALSPAAVIPFTNAVRDLSASIGEILLPVLDRGRVVIRAAADVVASLSPPARAMVAALAAGAVGMGVMTAGAIALSSAMSSATFGISTVLGAIAGVVVGAGVMSGTFNQFQGVIGKLANAAKPMLDAIGEGFQKVVAAAGPLFDALGGLARQAGGPLAETVRGLADTLASFGAQVVELVSAVAPTFLQIGQALASFGAGLLELGVTALRPFLAILTAIAPVVRIILTPFTAMSQTLGTVASLVSGVLNPALDVLMIPLKLVGDLFAGIGAEIQGALGDLQGAFRDVASLVADVAKDVAAGMKDLFEAFKPLLAEMVGPLTGTLRLAATLVREFAGWLRRMVAELRDLLGLPAAAVAEVGGASQDKAFRQAQTTSVSAYLQKLQESALGMGVKGPDPQKEVAKNTGVIAQAIKDLPDQIAEKLSAKLRAFLPAGGGVVPALPKADDWKALRERMDRLF